METGKLDGRNMKHCESLLLNPTIISAREYLVGFLQSPFTFGGVCFALYICKVILSFLLIVLGMFDGIRKLLNFLDLMFFLDRELNEYIRIHLHALRLQSKKYLFLRCYWYLLRAQASTLAKSSEVSCI